MKDTKGYLFIHGQPSFFLYGNDRLEKCKDFTIEVPLRKHIYFTSAQKTRSAALKHDYRQHAEMLISPNKNAVKKLSETKTVGMQFTELHTWQCLQWC